jgi:hypothetical protein
MPLLTDLLNSLSSSRGGKASWFAKEYVKVGFTVEVNSLKVMGNDW